jgi:hypothetical protein
MTRGFFAHFVVTLAIPSMLLGSRAVEAEAVEQWTICIGPDFAADAAVAAAVEDLQNDGARFGLSFSAAYEPPPPASNVLFVGDPQRNPSAVPLLERAGIRLEGATDPQGFEIRTGNMDGRRIMVVAGGSPMGDVYGLYWVWDRMRVCGKVPELNIERSPVLAFRTTEGGSAAEIRNALRHTANWVSGSLVDNLVPWDSEPEATQNAANREGLMKLIDSAHGYHMKYLAISDEFAYHPTLLKEFGATLDPADPALWEALQAKYRRLFSVLPELDGVRIRTGEHTRVTGTYKPFDVMHEPAECDWPLDQRYRTFVQKMHEVVVGEFDKLYFHRTWVTNTTEQHSDPEVYRSIFTDDVPTRNLYLSPYLSTGDRWYYQPYNPTFNQTPHNMFVLLSVLDYHSGGGTRVFPSFPGQYHQGGIQGILAHEKTNLAGMHFGIPTASRWDTWSLTAYTAFRLAWEPNIELRSIAEDFAAIHFGQEAAPQVAEILILSYEAYKDGIYIKPVAEGLSWNTLPHLRLTAFIAKGYPQLDHGRATIEWLRESMYEPCAGRTDETLSLLDRGRDAAVRMDHLYEGVPAKACDPELASQVKDALRQTRLLVETNNLYVRTCFAYFDYRDAPDQEKRDRLAEVLTALKDTCAEFIATPGFEYKLFGIEQLIINADAAVADLAQAEAALADAPDTEGVLRAIAEQQARHAEALGTLEAEAVKFLRWRGKVDGKDIISIRGETIALEHIQDDAPHSVSHEFFKPLPARPVTVLVKDVESQIIHPFVLEQPTAGNDYTFKLHLADRHRGYAWWEVELYFVDKSPEELGLGLPWQPAEDAS